MAKDGVGGMPLLLVAVVGLVVLLSSATMMLLLTATTRAPNEPGLVPAHVRTVSVRPVPPSSATNHRM